MTKIAVVGGGSTYTPELVSGLTRLDVDEFVLEDVDPERREVVGGMARRMLARQGFAGRLEVTEISTRRSTDADFVLIQIRVGGQEARLRDETAPLACGCIGQETTGAGGFAKAMRTVPVVLEIADGCARSPRPAPGSSTSRTRSASSRGPCSTAATAPSGSATSRSASSAVSPAGSASSRSASSSTRSDSTT